MKSKSCLHYNHLSKEQQIRNEQVSRTVRHPVQPETQASNLLEKQSECEVLMIHWAQKTDTSRGIFYLQQGF